MKPFVRAEPPERRIRDLLIASGIVCLGMILTAVLDQAFYNRSFFHENWPGLTLQWKIRSICIGLGLLAVFAYLCRGGVQKLSLDHAYKPSCARYCIIGSLVLHAWVIGTFLIHPTLFSTLSYEDGLFEYGSSALLFLSSVLVCAAGLSRRCMTGQHRAVRPTLILFGLVFFILAMEEISWFQRVLDLPTPELFEGNIQGELNLHNFNTNFSGNAYFFGAFLFPVMAAFIWFLYPTITKNRYLGTLAPRPYVAVIGSIACAYNFDMWDIPLTQIAFFGSVWVLLVFTLAASQTRDKVLIGFTMLTVFASQGLHLINGSNYDRRWELTEYKEFFIPLGLFMYSLDLLLRTRSMDQASSEQNGERSAC